MRLTELMNALAPHTASLHARPGIDPDITGLSADSRRLGAGYLFAGLPGVKHDGARFVPAAFAAGAEAALIGRQSDSGAAAIDKPILRADNPRQVWALLAAKFYGPQPRFVAGITGTNGKTSVAYFARLLWQALGHKAASLGTLGLIAPSLQRAGGLTTPDPVALHADLARLAAEGVDHAAIEASSHGLDQFRLDGIRFAAAAFTNLSRDHLDYHPDMGAYFAAKQRLFTELLPAGGLAAINADAPQASALLEIARRRRHRIMRFGQAGHELRLLAARPAAHGQHLVLDVLGSRHEIDLKLVGTFQAWNALAALALVLAEQVDPACAVAALGQLHGAPGRLQHVATLGNGAAIFVDYAHTPDALETVLLGLRPHARGRLLAVFGCGGDRDAGKRPIMGAIAAANADFAIVTDDNPRSEDPAAIRAAVIAGAKGGNFREIGDRRAAIAAAIDMLGAGDVLVIAGKGHESGQIVADTVVPFDDTAIARGLAQARGAAT